MAILQTSNEINFQGFHHFCILWLLCKKQAGIQENILDKQLQFRLVRVSIEVNLILTCWSCSKFWSIGLRRDRNGSG